MNNYEYMSMVEKLSKNDDHKNLVAGLLLTTVIVGAGLYIQYRIIQEQNIKIKGLAYSVEQLKTFSRKQLEINQQLSKKNAEQEDTIARLEKTIESTASNSKEKQGKQA